MFLFHHQTTGYCFQPEHRQILPLLPTFPTTQIQSRPSYASTGVKANVHDQIPLLTYLELERDANSWSREFTILTKVGKGGWGQTLFSGAQ